MQRRRGAFGAGLTPPPTRHPPLCPVAAESGTASTPVALERIPGCGVHAVCTTPTYEGERDGLRTGNAQRHDLHDLRMIPLCTVLDGGVTATEMARFAGARRSSCAVYSICPSACPTTIPSRARFGCSIR